MKSKLMAGLIACLLAFALANPAEAKHKRKHTRSIDRNGIYAVVHTAAGLTSKVIASAREKFQAFIDAVEQDSIYDERALVVRGNRIADFGCLSSGHMRNSKHHWGGACDFEQTDRDVTASYMRRVTEIARRFGLVDGCEFKDRRGPDCGHIEVPGSNTASLNPTYRLARNDKIHLAASSHGGRRNARSVARVRDPVAGAVASADQVPSGLAEPLPTDTRTSARRRLASRSSWGDRRQRVRHDTQWATFPNAAAWQVSGQRPENHLARRRANAVLELPGAYNADRRQSRTHLVARY